MLRWIGTVVLAMTALAGQTSQPVFTPSLPFEQIRAELRADQTTVNVGQPVWVEFVLRNDGDEVAELVVPGTQLDSTACPAMGLPTQHVFSGPSWRALAISNGLRKRLGDSVVFPPAGPVRPIRIAPQASVGLRLDVARLYPALRQPGRYSLLWKPYGGLVRSNELVIRIERLKRVVIETDYGRMTVKLLYDKAPNHVANFLELVDQGFYNGLTFHRVVPGAIIQGGDPRGDGTGIRPDGRTLQPEFNDTLFQEGTVGMALTPGDPDSASCQFFICLRRLGALDGKYTAFGQLVGQESLETLRKIGSVPTDQADQPLKPVYIRSMVARPEPVEQ